MDNKLDLQGEVMFILGEGGTEGENGGAGENNRCGLLVRGCMGEYGGVATYVLLLVLVVIVVLVSARDHTGTTDVVYAHTSTHCVPIRK